MASGGILFPEELAFSCAICLDVFSSPVSTPCGHNFCRTCITMFWDKQVNNKCPTCNEIFLTKPELRVNTFIAEMTANFTRSVQLKEPCVEPGDVPCDICSGTQLKAVKSCLMCLSSYCDTHLEPHGRVAGLKTHQLVEPMDCLVDRMCTEHHQLLELFCKTEQVFVCKICTETGHKFHPVVPLTEEYDVKIAQLGNIDSVVQQRIQERQQMIQFIRDAMELNKEDTHRELAEGAQVIKVLICFAEECWQDFSQTVADNLKSTDKQCEGLIKELEQDIEDLTNRSSEVKRLSHREDHLHFVQTFRSLNTHQGSRDWGTMEDLPSPPVDTLRRSLDQLEETLNTEMKKLHDAELSRLRQYEVDVSLNPDTANPQLILSDDEKQVHDGDDWNDLPESPERFSLYPYVLTEQSFSSGRFYFEVETKGKTKWEIGVARRSINRIGRIMSTPKNGFWTLNFKYNEFIVNCDPVVQLPVRAKPQKVGVFVDYDKGLVSFYEVTEMVHIYSARGCDFSEPLHGILKPGLNNGGENIAPLIISPVSQMTGDLCRSLPRGS